FTEAINATFPKTDVQSCIIHQLRNNSKTVPNKNRKEFMNDLKNVYKAFTIEQAEMAFEEFKAKWEKKHPSVIKSWENNWLELTTYFSYPVEIRKLIYTTNTMEAFHRQLRKVTKTKTAYPTDNALRKIVYLATIGVTDKWTIPVSGWLECRQQFEIMFEGRFGK
ncbi:transposase, partial [Priestia megaterium]|uniref:IS256 family transposase n=1 Tax=Priestia megaterium TaxID=1404 RepID=UPI002E1A143C